jgi:hypothetical protein
VPCELRGATAVRPRRRAPSRSPQLPASATPPATGASPCRRTATASSRTGDRDGRLPEPSPGPHFQAPTTAAGSGQLRSERQSDTSGPPGSLSLRLWRRRHPRPRLPQSRDRIGPCRRQHVATHLQSLQSVRAGPCTEYSEVDRARQRHRLERVSWESRQRTNGQRADGTDRSTSPAHGS